MRIGADLARAYSGFCSDQMDGMLVHCRVTPSIKFIGTHLYTWKESHCDNQVSCSRTQLNVPAQDSNPGPLNPKSSALTMRPTLFCLPLVTITEAKNVSIDQFTFDPDICCQDTVFRDVVRAICSSCLIMFRSVM